MDVIKLYIGTTFGKCREPSGNFAIYLDFRLIKFPDSASFIRL